MSSLVYRIMPLFTQVLQGVPVGTNLGLFHLMFALLSGRFLPSRGATFPALSDMGLSPEAVRRASAALREGGFVIATLLSNWQRLVQKEGAFQAREHEGVRPVACDLTAFYRPHLRGLTSKHYHSVAGKALPALVFGLCVRVGSVGKQRLGLPCLILRGGEQESDETLQNRLLVEAAKHLKTGEALVADAGFDLATMLLLEKPFVIRLAKNATARRNYLPPYCGRGRHPEYGVTVRPLARSYDGRKTEATKPDKVVQWKYQGRTLVAHIWEGVVASDAHPGAATFRVIAIYDPHYRQPLLLATSLSVSAEAVWLVYKDRWPVEQVALAGKPMLGCERAYVFGAESRYRLPELALLCGNILSYLAATAAPVATGFWDRAARPTCGRLRRTLARMSFSDLPEPLGQIRKKNSVTAHLLTGVTAHRRHKKNTEAKIDQIAL